MFFERFLIGSGSYLGSEKTNFRARRRCGGEPAIVHKPLFYLKKTCVFEVGGAPGNDKNKSESDVQTKLDFIQISD